MTQNWKGHSYTLTDSKTDNKYVSVQRVGKQKRAYEEEIAATRGIIIGYHNEPDKFTSSTDSSKLNHIIVFCRTDYFELQIMRRAKQTHKRKVVLTHTLCLDVYLSSYVLQLSWHS